MAIFAIEEIAQERGSGSAAVHYSGFAAEWTTPPRPEVADLDFNRGADFTRCKYRCQRCAHPGISKCIQHSPVNGTVRIEMIRADIERHAAPAISPLINLESQEVRKWM